MLILCERCSQAQQITGERRTPIVGGETGRRASARRRSAERDPAGPGPLEVGWRVALGSDEVRKMRYEAWSRFARRHVATREERVASSVSPIREDVSQP